MAEALRVWWGELNQLFLGLVRCSMMKASGPMGVENMCSRLEEDGRGGGRDEGTHSDVEMYECILCLRLFTLKLVYIRSLHTKYVQQIACADS